MSFKLPDGATFVPKSAQTHAQEILTYDNSILQGLGLPTMVAGNDNALYWTMLGAGNLQQIYDTALSSAGNSMNPALCDDNQILNLLPLAGTQLIGASPTTMTIHAVATGGGSCIIPTLLNFSYGGIAYQITSGITIAPSGYSDLPAQALTNGPNIVLSGAISVLSITDPVPSNLASFTNQANAIPGRLQETPAQARARLQRQTEMVTPWDKCQVALNNLAGVTLASVFFNPSSTNVLVLSGGVSVPPRNAYIVMAGSNNLVAQTYWSCMFSPTSGHYTQNYTSRSNQVLGVSWDTPAAQAVYVKVYIDANKPLGFGYQSEIDTLLLTLNGIFLPGSAISTETVLPTIATAQQSSVVSALLSTDGVNYYTKVSPNANSVPFFSSDPLITTFASI